jgi:hypothetical protein
MSKTKHCAKCRKLGLADKMILVGEKLYHSWCVSSVTSPAPLEAESVAQPGARR